MSIINDTSRRTSKHCYMIKKISELFNNNVIIITSFKNGQQILNYEYIQF